MKNILMVLSLLISVGANAATPPELPLFEPRQSAMDQAALIAAATRCGKALLKNDGYGMTYTPNVFGLVPKAANNTVDPSVIIDTDQATGTVEMRHIFAVTGFVAAGIIRADLTFQAKDNKYRMTWHDVAYAQDAPNWQNDFTPLIKQALPHKKAVQALADTAQKLAECIDKPATSENW